MVDRLKIDRALRRVARKYHMPVTQVKRNI